MDFIEIDHERYGDVGRYHTLSAALAFIRSCGEEFSMTTLRETGNGIVDETGEVVGHVYEVIIDRIGQPFGQSGSQAEEGHRLVEVAVHLEDEQGNRDGFETLRVPIEAGMTDEEISVAVEKYIAAKMV